MKEFKITNKNKQYTHDINQLINRFTMLSLEHAFYLSVLYGFEKELTAQDLINIDFKKTISSDHEIYFKWLYFKRKFLKLSKEHNTHYDIQTLHGTNYIYLTKKGLTFINSNRHAFKPSYMRAVHYQATSLVCIKYFSTFSLKYPNFDVHFLTDYEIKSHPIYSEFKAKPDLLVIFNNSKNKNIAVEVELTLKNNQSFNNKLDNLKYDYNDFHLVFWSDNSSVTNFIKKYNENCKLNDTFGNYQEVFTYAI